MVADVKLKSHAGQSFLRPVLLALALLFLAGLTVGAYFIPPSDDTIRQLLVRQSVASYLSTGRICPCPYSLNRMGLRCLHQTDDGRPSGARSLCYPDDITDAMVRAWRDNHR